MSSQGSFEVSRRGFLTGVGALSVLAGLGLAGCSGNGSAASGSAAGSGEAASYRDTLKIALPAQPPTLDTATTSSSVTVDIMANVFEPLFALDADYKPQPVLADTVETSSDGLTVTVKLRSGVKFHDGSDLTPDDVVASMNYWQKANERAETLLPGAVWASAGEDAVACTLTAPASDLLTILATHGRYAAIVPKATIEGKSDSGITSYVGTGAYKFGEWKQDQYITLERFDGYRPAAGKPSGYTGKASAPTKTLEYDFVTDASTRVQGMQSGEYDIADEIPTENFSDFDGNSEFKLYQRKSGTLTLFANMNKGVLANEKIRQAVFAAVDCKATALAAYGDENLFSLSPSLVNSEDKQWATEKGKEYWNQADPKKAKKLAKEAGYNGEKIRLLTTPEYKEMNNACVALQEQLEKAGFTAEVQPYEFSTFMDIRSGKPDEWDLFVASIGYPVLPAQSLAVSSDFYGLSDQQALDLVRATRSASDHAAAKGKWEQAQERLYQIAAVETLCQYVSLSATAADVTGVEPFVGLVVWNARRPE